MSVNTKVNGELVKSAGLYKTSVPIQSGDIYSLEERQVAVWTDGKPLYQKTVDCGNLPNNSRKEVAHNIANIDTVVSSIGIMGNGTSFAFIPYVSTGTQYQVPVDVNKTNIVITTGQDRSGFTGYVTIKYTKTTDVPGSGEYVPSGDKAEHYSTDEEVIGTWLGQTLYRKVYQYTGSSIVCATNTWTKIPFITDVNTLKDGKIYDSNGTLFLGMWGKVDGEIAFYNLRNTAITIDSGSEVMVEYTKTS